MKPLFEKVKVIERKVCVLEKKNIGYIFCEYCEEEFEERRKLELHVMNTHTFKCEVCKNKLSSKEELDFHLTAFEVYDCYVCDYMHKRLSELKTHCKNKHTGNVSILCGKMDRETISEATCKKYYYNDI